MIFFFFNKKLIHWFDSESRTKYIHGSVSESRPPTITGATLSLTPEFTDANTNPFLPLSPFPGVFPSCHGHSDLYNSDTRGFNIHSFHRDCRHLSLCSFPSLHPRNVPYFQNSTPISLWTAPDSSMKPSPPWPWSEYTHNEGPTK